MKPGPAVPGLDRPGMTGWSASPLFRPGVGPATWFVVPPAAEAAALLPSITDEDDEDGEGADPGAIYGEFTRMEDAGPLSLGGTRAEVGLANERSVASAGWSSIGRAFEAGTFQVGPSGRPWWVAGVFAWVEAGNPRYPASHDELEEDQWFAGVALDAPGAGAFVLVDRNAVVGPFTLVDRRVVAGRVRSSGHRTWTVFLDASHHLGEQRSSHGELGVEARMSTALAGVGFDTRTGSPRVPEVGLAVEYRTAAVASEGEDVGGWPSPYTPLRRAHGFAPGAPAVSGPVDFPGEVTTLRFTVRTAAGGVGPVDVQVQHLIVPGDRGAPGLWEVDLAHPVTLTEAGRLVVGYTAYTRGSEGTPFRGPDEGMGHLVSVQWALEFQD